MIYVTGASGFIGSNTIRSFIEEHIPCEAISRNPLPIEWDLEVKVHVGSFMDESFLRSFLKQDDVIIHCAGVIDVFHSQKQQSDLVNMEGTKIMTSICEELGVFLVFVSSVDAIYKSDSTSTIFEPTDFIFPKWPNHYTYVKAKSAEWVYSLLQSNQLKGAIVYPSAVVGPRDYKPSLIGKEIKKIIHSKVLFALRGGYNFIDVRDVAKGLVKIALYKKKGSFLLTAHEATIQELYHMIRMNLKSKKRVISIPNVIAKGFVMLYKNYSMTMIHAIEDNYHYSNKKMIRELDVHPRPLEETIQDTLNWFLDRDQNKKETL